MEFIGCFLNKNGYTLRSGHADGSDIGFENGAGDNKEIYLPWKRFNNSTSNLFNPLEKAFQISGELHPEWGCLKYSSQKLHARNAHQVLGLDLNSPSYFVICYTKSGLDIGGTAQALRIARKFNVPIFNLGFHEVEIIETKNCISLFQQFLPNFLDNNFKKVAV